MPVQALAERLRSLRERAGLSYRQLAETTAHNASTFSRAASGTTVPTEAVLTIYANRCQATKAERRELRTLWRLARRAQEPTDRAVPLDLIRHPIELCDAMAALRARIGRPSLRMLEARAGGLGKLPHSTLSLVLRGRAMPSRYLLEHFVRACGVPRSETERWLKAWDRVSASRITPREAKNLLLQYRDLVTAERQADGTVRLSMPSAGTGPTRDTSKSGWGLQLPPAATTTFRLQVNDLPGRPGG
ncbi:helix-turn-helix domain-containing protein [Kitasatospora kifunensis]|uniref:Transcriptional regulator with XRE-family HTH domain n=1 Tax=Kitasatospora kifunensis TaxID=58351 RepID=A0A7W7RBV7_KITKI|nr:helix-turn-helix transcriptional regulator [Kitasatospora kifunensis]MBB4928838.1 transcriptional regulator with XRE-family HTH domain [Kitasatospora kifunensis]